MLKCYATQVLDLMVRMLGFSDEDKRRIGLAQQASGKTAVRGVLGLPGRLVGGILGGRSSEVSPVDMQSETQVPFSRPCFHLILIFMFLVGDQVFLIIHLYCERELNEWPLSHISLIFCVSTDRLLYEKNSLVVILALILTLCPCFVPVFLRSVG